MDEDLFNIVGEEEILLLLDSLQGATHKTADEAFQFIVAGFELDNAFDYILHGLPRDC